MTARRLAACILCLALKTAGCLMIEQANVNCSVSIGGPGHHCSPNCAEGRITAVTSRGKVATRLPDILAIIQSPFIGCAIFDGPWSIHTSQGGIKLTSCLVNTLGMIPGSTSFQGKLVLCTFCHLLLDSSGTARVEVHHDPVQCNAYRPPIRHHKKASLKRPKRHIFWTAPNHRL